MVNVDFFRVGDLVATEVLPGIFLRSVNLDDLMMTFVEYREGAEVPAHHHGYQQITLVQEGFLEIEVGSLRRVLGPGEGVRIPAQVEHASRSVEGVARAIDAWTPVPKSLTLEDLAVFRTREQVDKEHEQ